MVCIATPSVSPVHCERRERSTSMRIGILGTGAMARALGGAWVRAGHDVRIGGRDTAAAARAADLAGAAGHGTLAEAAAHGEAVLVAVPAVAAPGLVESLAGPLAGRVLLDCTVPMAPGGDGRPVLTATVPVARQLAEAAPGSYVAKVFGLVHESIWTMDRPSFEDAPLAVPFCADAPEAVRLTTELVSSMHCTALPCGGLHRAGLLEATAVFAIGVWWSGAEVPARFPRPSPGAGRRRRLGRARPFGRAAAEPPLDRQVTTCLWWWSWRRMCSRRWPTPPVGSSSMSWRNGTARACSRFAPGW
ncbi:NAD(P)-binding domain-containing protein [Streptomyces sp. NPDC049837]|uniref:NADPH-dependent F420 reductase n=1 Tax=Streptomyces sp. NPDC049837 TaxID=3155277 RepID=UPI003447929B